MKKLLPILLAVIGLGAGAGAGLLLKPEPVEEAGPCGPDEINGDVQKASAEPEVEETPREYIQMSNQFVVPLVRDGQVRSLVLLSLSLEVTGDSRDAVFQREPKLRDQFLQVLFDHANSGGFDGNFTSGLKMGSLRSSLMDVAEKQMGDMISDILVTDIIRQEA